jgi:hypothetical protein
MSDVYDMDSFTLNIHGGYDANNIPLAGSTAEKSGFIERKQRITVDANGENVLSSANIFIEYLPTVTLEDTVTFDGRNWNIVAIGVEKDFTNKKTRLYLS